MLFGRKSATPFIGGLGLFLGGVLLLFASLTSVPAQSVGVVTSFGKPVNTLTSGIHWKVPWHVVHDMDARTQIDDNLGDRGTEIRLGNQANALVQNSLRWKIKTDAAGQLFADYRDFDRIGPGLVEQELAAALNYGFSDYDPLASAKAEADASGGQQQSYDDVADAVQARLDSRIGDRILIESVIIPKVDFDAATQAGIDAYHAEIGNTRIAEQRKKTAAAEAEANRVLADSVSRDPNVLVSKCFDQLAEMVDKGQPVLADSAVGRVQARRSSRTLDGRAGNRYLPGRRRPSIVSHRAVVNNPSRDSLLVGKSLSTIELLRRLRSTPR